MSVSFQVPGVCVPCPRPRVPAGKKAYYPTRYTDWIDSAKVAARQAWLGVPPLDGPVEMKVVFAGARANADLDNLLKSVMDAIQGVLVADDKQVAAVYALRLPIRDRGQACTSVEVCPIT